MGEDPTKTGNQPPANTPPANQPPANQPPTQPTGLSQEEVDRIVSRRVNEATEAERKRITDKFNGSLEEAEALFKSEHEKKEKEKSDLERLQGEFDKFKNDSTAEKEKLQKETHTDKVKLRLARSGVVLPEDEKEATEALNRVVRLVNSEVGVSVEDIDEDIKALKAQMPGIFQSESQSKGNPSSNPSGSSRTQPPAEPVSKKAEDRAAEWARVNRGINPST